MGSDPLAAAGRLADVLAAENAALSALDLTGAAALLPAKERAVAELTRALGGFRPSPEDDPAREVAARLDGLARENRRLLERALRAQEQVIATLARAARQAGTREAPRYGRRGSLAPDGGGRALSSRA